jgi:hypothetical protein
MAALQRPLATAGFEEKASRAARRTKPAGAVLPSADGAIHPEMHRFSCERAKRW